MNNNALWYEKYRPSKLDGYITENVQLRQKIQGWINKPETLPHMILTGPSGVGKTTLSFILRDELKLDGSDFKFIKSSINSGIDTIRNEVTNFCENGGWSNLKLIVFDEAERLTIDSQEGLRNIIDEFGSNVRFIFTCNDITRICGALKSRARAYHIDALDEESFTDKLIDIATKEAIELDGDGISVITQIIEKTYPDLRKAIDLLQDAFDGKNLILPSEKDVVQDWEEDLILVIKNKKPLSAFKEAIQGYPKEKLTAIYQFMYQSSGKLFRQDAEGEAIVIIAEHLALNEQVSFPDINMCACVVKLGMISHE